MSAAYVSGAQQFVSKTLNSNYAVKEDIPKSPMDVTVRKDQ